MVGLQVVLELQVGTVSMSSLLLSSSVFVPWFLVAAVVITITMLIKMASTLLEPTLIARVLAAKPCTRSPKS